MKISSILLLLFISWTAVSGQIITKKISKQEIPSSIKFKGKMVDGYRWKDISGDNLLILCEQTDIPSSSKEYEDLRSAALYAYHYLITADSTTLTWKVQDFVNDCSVDIVAEFVKNSTSVTDLDKNGLTETWIVYRTACKGDISASDMKIIMYEGKKKYALRGRSKVIVGKEQDGGDKTFDYAFKNGSVVFRQYATKLWDKYVLENKY